MIRPLLCKQLKLTYTKKELVVSSGREGYKLSRYRSFKEELQELSLSPLGLPGLPLCSSLIPDYLLWAGNMAAAVWKSADGRERCFLPDSVYLTFGRAVIGPRFKSHAHSFGQLASAGKCEAIIAPAGPAEPTLEVEAWPSDQGHHQKIRGRDGEKTFREQRELL